MFGRSRSSYISPGQNELEEPFTTEMQEDGKGSQQDFADQSGVLPGPQVTICNLEVARENHQSLK